MRKHEFWGFQVEMDDEATKTWYAQSKPWACECGDCRNFVELARRRALPTPILAALKHMGIPPEKATYVCEMIPQGDGHLYQFSYRIAGHILNENDSLGELMSWGQARCCHEIYPYGAPGFPEPHFDLEFWVTLPWVLEEKAEGIK